MTDVNKNVTALLDAASFRSASYTYGPFGQVLSMDGALAEVNTFRFSSEFHDDETGLVYYNYRYYSPSLGRWTKRDPIGEAGNTNVYGNSNAAVNVIDRLGLYLIAFDGTANYEDERTNVFLLHELYDNEAGKHYIRGIGNRKDYSTGVARDVICARGWTIGGKVDEGLRVLEDEISRKPQVACSVDAVGFSRGAITAVKFAKKLEAKVKAKDGVFRLVPNVRFLGLFDPVPGGKVTRYEKMTPFVKQASIAYSITESRLHFSPTYYYGENVTSLFFWGGHSDIGGGYKDRGLANITLNWMIGEGIRAGAPFSWAPQGWEERKLNGFTRKAIRHQEFKAKAESLKWIGIEIEADYPMGHREFPEGAHSHPSVDKYNPSGVLPSLPLTF